MHLSLNNFQDTIDPTILRRGRSYYQQHKVERFEEIFSGTYKAHVAGSEDYTVQLTFKNDLIIRYSCDCPYDQGPVCKHIVAVIFCVASGSTKSETDTSRKSKKPKHSPRKKSPTPTANDLLEKLSQDELKEFVHQQVLKNPDFQDKVISAFANKSNSESTAFYKRQIKSLLKTAGDRHGFIDWYAVQRVGRAVFELVDTARTHLKNGNYQSTFFIACAVLEEMTAALQFADDSNADIGDNIDFALELLFGLTSVDLAAEQRQQLFEYTLQSYRKGIFEGWDWHLGMLELAARIFQGDAEAEAIMKLLDQAETIEYRRETAQGIKLTILQKTKGAAAAKKYLEQHLSNPKFRSVAIQNAISKKDFEKAIELAEAGIRQDAKRYPGLADDWVDWLLKIADKQGNSEKVLEYATLLLSVPNRDWRLYYNTLEKHIPPDQWTGFVENLIGDLLNRGGWTNYYLSTQILIKEEWWNQLWDVVSRGYQNQIFGLKSLKSFEKYLKKDHANEMAGFYEEKILQFLEENTGRAIYQKACRYIRWIIKLGAWEKAQQLVEKLRKMYSRRPALLQELDRI
ncbi:MAG: SWIM zinc finger family protein [Lentisphaeria bacterium]|nr:SWIM zinc finger family protein [Candidatus Neomarinimicrobiota bacterium]MCF7842535.1 SWIM zinc finger family protein [Lentisphaeria bacterium]